MLFDGRQVETAKHTHKGTSSQIDNGGARLKSTKALLMQRET